MFIVSSPTPDEPPARPDTVTLTLASQDDDHVSLLCEVTSPPAEGAFYHLTWATGGSTSLKQENLMERVTAKTYYTTDMEAVLYEQVGHVNRFYFTTK